MINMNSGYYRVGDKVYTSKFEALLIATNTKQKVTFHFYDEIWDYTINSFNPDNINLLEMYKERAQQIRDKYDYLVLHFSGGSDSVTVLQAFIHNGIKLDEVYVKWPVKLLKSGIYTPDINNTDPSNMLSEWDFSIKPKLDWLKEHHPEIKIVVHDWTDDLYKFDIKSLNENLLFRHNQTYGLTAFVFAELISESSIEMENKGLSVAQIYGVEKPSMIYFDEKKEFFTFFNDIITTVGFQHAHGKTDLNNRVDFFTTFDYPQMTIARTYAMLKYFKNNPSKLYLIDSNNKYLPTDERVNRINEYQQLCSIILYPNWNINTFQVRKHDVLNRKFIPWYYYIYDSVEFLEKKNKIEKMVNDISIAVDDNYKVLNVRDEMIGLKPMVTKFFKLK